MKRLDETPCQLCGRPKSHGAGRYCRKCYLSANKNPGIPDAAWGALRALERLGTIHCDQGFWGLGPHPHVREAMERDGIKFPTEYTELEFDGDGSPVKPQVTP